MTHDPSAESQPTPDSQGETPVETAPSSAVENTSSAAAKSPADETSAAPAEVPVSGSESVVAPTGGEAAEPPSGDRPARKIAIGSQRDVAQPTGSAPRAVAVAKENPVRLDREADAEPVAAAPAPEIKSSAGLSDDIDAEIEAMMNDVSMESILGGVSDTPDELAEGSRIKAMIARVHGDSVFFALPGPYEGVASLGSFKTPPAEGTLLEVVIRELNADEGLYEVGIPGAAVDVAEWEDINEGDVVEARVTGSNTGGLEVVVGNIRGFIPASQIDRVRVENFGDFVGQKLNCVVVEVNPPKKLVVSRRAILDREAEVRRKELLETLEPGQTLEGVVTRLMDFGAFIDLGGAEGLAHISKLAWDRVKHPREVLQEGERVKVKIESIDRQTGKISLSHRDTMEDPWARIDQKYVPNETVTGTVTRVAEFGAFVKLEPGIEGLVHISEIAHHRVVRVGTYLNEGDQVECKVLSIDPASQKISLSIKATQAAPQKGPREKEEVEEEVAARPLAVPKSDAPLKGGTDRRSGGEDFGLKW